MSHYFFCLLNFPIPYLFQLFLFHNAALCRLFENVYFSLCTIYYLHRLLDFSWIASDNQSTMYYQQLIHSTNFPFLHSTNFHVWVHIESNWNIPFSFMDKLRRTTECGFNLKLIRDIIITYSQMHCTDKYLQKNSIIWPVWLNDWVFVYKLSGCGFKFRCSHVSCYFMKKLFFFQQSYHQKL